MRRIWSGCTVRKSDEPAPLHLPLRTRLAKPEAYHFAIDPRGRNGTQLASVADQARCRRWSGRIEARIGLRMMPTFPRSPLSFRTASFPQYGWKADCPSGAFLGDRRLKPAPGIPRPPSSLHPPFVHFVVATVVRSESGLRTRSCTAMRWNTPPTPGALARVRVVVSRSVIT